MTEADKHKARARVSREISRGRIPSARTLPCAQCGHVWTKRGDTRHEYHHPKGYEGDNALIVEPLCIPCHVKAHPNRIASGRQWNLHSVRLEDEVWAAVKALKPESLNQYLRRVLLDGSTTTEQAAPKQTVLHTPSRTMCANLRKEASEINKRNRVPGDPHWKGPILKPKERKE